MNITLRTKIFIVGGLIIGFLLALGLLLYIFRDKNNGNPVVPNGNTANQETVNTGGTAYKNTNNSVPQNQIIESTAPTSLTSDQVYVKQLANLFMERFNTYSNRNDNVHITDALALSTQDMADWLNSQKITQSGSYYGVTTKVLASSITSLSKDKAKVTVGVEETTYKTGAEDISKFRTGVIDLVKVDSEWKVNRFRWEE